MTLPFSLGTITLPDWLPGWVPVVLLLPVVIWLLLLVAMPFAVLGLRARLEGIEAQLDDLHAELRALAMRVGAAPLPPMPEPKREDRLGSAWAEPPSAHTRASPRAEPRIEWPRAPEPRLGEPRLGEPRPGDVRASRPRENWPSAADD